MRDITLVIADLGPGGAQRVLTWLANRWVAGGRRVDLITLDDGATSPHHPLDPGVVHRPLAVAGRSRGPGQAVAANARRLSALRRALRASGPRPVLSFVDTTNVLACLSAFAEGRPTVVSERIDPAHHPIPRAWAALRPAAYRLASAIVVQTEAARAHLPSGLHGRTTVIPNAIAPATVAAGGGGGVVAMGRLDPQKGFDLLLHAFADLARRHPSARLTVWGEGRERAALEALRDRLGLADRVRFPGVTREPAAALGSADVFVLSSRYEGFPNVLGEAMALGRAVVATDCPSGPRDLVTDGIDGRLVPPGDAGALADGIAGLLDDVAERARLGDAARRSIERFAPDRIGRRWDAVLTRACPGWAAEDAAP